jgi:hypothetical protein
MLLAAASSRAAYATDTADPPPTSLHILDSVEQSTSASRDGSIKACILVSRETSTSVYLVVAFRGTASLVDWLVNLDGDLEDATAFLSPSQIGETPASGHSMTTVAHAGLLRVATAMVPNLCDKILNHTPTFSNSKPPILLLTGHSAGGGVAGLVSAHIRAQRGDILSRFATVHCVTFAAPPVIGSPTVQESLSLPSPLSLNIVNFQDIVPRASKAYIRSILALYSERAENVIEEEWDFGEPDVWNYGSNILLMDISNGVDDDNNEAIAEGADSNQAAEEDLPNVRAFKIDNEIWKRLAFGSVRTHPMEKYLNGIEALSRR